MAKRYRLKPFWRKLHERLFSKKSHEFMVFLFFLALSFVFWMLQTLDETFETDIEVPVQLVDVPGDVVITSPLPSEITVTVRDKGTALVGLWRQKKSPVFISFESYDNGDSYGHARISPSDVTKMLQDQMSSSTKIQAIRPDTLEFYFNHGKNKVVPVHVVSNIETSAGNYLLEVKANPSSVTVYASDAVLDTLTCVYTRPLVLTDLEESTSKQLGFAKLRGAKMEPANVTVTATVDAYTENSVDVPVESINFPGDKELRTFPATVSVTYTVGLAHNSRIKAEDFHILVTYEELLRQQKSGKNGKLKLHLKSVPKEVKNVRILPSEVDYLIENTAEEEGEE